MPHHHSTAAVTPHDQVGRLALEFLRDAPGCGLPRAAAFIAFTRARDLSRESAEVLRFVLRVVEAG
jgi:hypothetical protein